MLDSASAICWDTSKSSRIKSQYSLMRRRWQREAVQSHVTYLPVLAVRTDVFELQQSDEACGQRFFFPRLTSQRLPWPEVFPIFWRL